MTLAPGFRETPFWWEASPLQDRSDPLPARVDVAVIGSGYTGLHAALVLARAGRSVAVLEAGRLGEGCSTRNGGQVSTSVKPSWDALRSRHGEAAARLILENGIASRRFVEAFVAAEGIACAFRPCGRFHAAHTPRAARAMAAALTAGPDDLRPRASVVPRDAQGAEIGTDAFHGGVVFHDHAELDPGRYHAGLLARAAEAGASFHAGTAALALDDGPGGVTVGTGQGAVHARDVIVATNGYVGGATPWHRRRIIPIGSQMIATAPVDPTLMARLNPRGRIFSDSRRVVYYWRTSPCGRRILFGGRVAAGEVAPRTAARRLHAVLAAIHPDLARVPVTHGWTGLVGYTFDTLAHAGSRGGIHHAMGYCGSGVGMASHMGHQIGRRILGTAARCGDAAADIPFPTRPLYTGRPWFLPAAVAWKRALDRVGR